MFAAGGLIRTHGRARTTPHTHTLADRPAARLHAPVSGGIDAALPPDAKGFQLRQREPGDAAVNSDDGGLFCAELSHRGAGGQNEPQAPARFRARPQRSGLRGAGTGAELCVGARGRGGGRVWRQFLPSRGDGDGGAPVPAHHGQGAGPSRHRGRCGLLCGAALCRLARGDARAGTGSCGLATASARAGHPGDCGRGHLHLAGG